MPCRHHPHAGTPSRIPSLTLAFTLCATLWSASVAHATTNPTALMGYTAGAQTMTVKVENGQIDEMSGVVYQQIKQVRRFDQLKMTLLIPRTKTAKPAIVYFPGVGSRLPTMKNSSKCAMHLPARALWWPRLNTVPFRPAFPDSLKTAKRRYGFCAPMRWNSVLTRTKLAS